MKYKIMCESPKASKQVLKATMDSPDVPISQLKPTKSKIYNSPDVPQSMFKSNKKGKEHDWHT